MFGVGQVECHGGIGLFRGVNTQHRIASAYIQRSIVRRSNGDLYTLSGKDFAIVTLQDDRFEVYIPGDIRRRPYSHPDIGAHLPKGEILSASRRISQHGEKVRSDTNLIFTVSGRKISLQEIHLSDKAVSLASQQFAIRIESKIGNCVRQRFAFEHSFGSIEFLDSKQGSLSLIPCEYTDSVRGFPLHANASGAPSSGNPGLFRL